MKTVFPLPVPPPLDTTFEYYGGWVVATGEVAACGYDGAAGKVEVILRSGRSIVMDCPSLEIARRTLTPVCRKMNAAEIRSAT